MSIEKIAKCIKEFEKVLVLNEFELNDIGPVVENYFLDDVGYFEDELQLLFENFKTEIDNYFLSCFEINERVKFMDTMIIRFRKYKVEKEETLEIYELQNSFLEKIKNYLEEKRTEITTEKPLKELKPLVWNGNMKELAELFLVLSKKGWIKEFHQDGDLKQYTETLSNAFRMDKKKINSKSFYQYLKGEINGEEKDYPEVYSDRYKPKFEEIKVLSSK